MFLAPFPGLIQSIPLASLAAILVVTGYRLASPKVFVRVMDVGKEQFLMFVVTIIGVLAVDLLAGVALGIVVKLAINRVRGVWLSNLFKSISHSNNKITIRGLSNYYVLPFFQTFCC
ncbi:hypothetical protein MGMO_167c00170 [Methyloglobulus morosus KoM1]|uniref:Sulfate permease n=1 Tax=Methyloglobulus morosus KoM1 TaxID=1116472 RepID=V5DJ06_9GAMM|nr:hypothetical protein MGMO_167c00170 [Methyloglobulus morosus KoM1]